MAAQLRTLAQAVLLRGVGGTIFRPQPAIAGKCDDYALECSSNHSVIQTFSHSFRYIFVSLPSVTVEWPGSRGYHDKVIDHYENPRNVGSLDKNDENVGTGLVGAPACGDVMKLQVYQTVIRYFTISVTKITMQMKYKFYFQKHLFRIDQSRR